MEVSVDNAAFEQWLAAYGAAWEQRDGEAFAALFAPGCAYFWTPFEEPRRGRGDVAEAFSAATGTQEDIHFGYQSLGVLHDTGIAHWRTSLRRTTSGARVHIDGMLTAAFDDDGLCRTFREWWHSDERR